jgi:hypothetical protein
MARIDKLLKAYAEHITIPWRVVLSGAERTLFAIYDKEDERRLRLRISDFQDVTERAGRAWLELDLTHAFPKWMAQQEYRDAYFETPDALEGYETGQFSQFTEHLVQSLKEQIRAGAGSNHVVALIDVGGLFGLSRVSKIVEGITSVIQGRLLVFFPGERIENNYRLLGACDGWNYLAVPLGAGH